MTDYNTFVRDLYRKRYAKKSEEWLLIHLSPVELGKIARLA